MESVSFLHYTHPPLFSSGFRMLRKKLLVTDMTRKKRTRISATTTSSDGVGALVLSDELKFKRSFDEYLKALESVKTERNNNDRHHRSNPNYQEKKTIKRAVPEEEKPNDVTTLGKQNSRYRGFHRQQLGPVHQDSGNGVSRDGIDAEKSMKKQRKIVKGKKNDDFIDVERAAFRPLYSEDVVVDKRRITRAYMEERIQKLSKSLNGADIDMPEWMFSKMMRSAQIRFSDHSILRIIQILGKFGNWRRVLQVIEWIESRERYKSHKIRNVYTAALDALGKAKRPVEALNLFHKMQEQLASYPDIIAYHCIAVTLGQAGHMKELFDVIDTMRSPPKKKFKTDLIGKWDPRLEPDVIVYNSILNACVQCKKWEGAFWVLQQLSQQGQQPSSTTYGLVMEVMLACGKYNFVHDFFKKVQKSYIPNALIYKVLVNTYWREGKADEAIMAVEEMERRGIVGNAGLYYDLARCLCSAGRCQEALEQIEKICKVASKPLVVTYTGLVQACLDSGNVKSGVYIFNHMQKFCSPNLVTYNIMLKAFVDNDMFEEAKQLFLNLLENSNFIGQSRDYKVRIIPDIYSFNTMLDACARKQKWDDLEFVFKQMLKFGYHFNEKRHLRMLLEEELLEMTWKSLIKTQRVPHPLLIREMFYMNVEKGDYTTAFSYIVDFAPVECQVFSRGSWLKFLSENADLVDEHTLGGLAREGTTLLSKTENLAITNLLVSCKEYLADLKTPSRSGDAKVMEIASRPEYQAAFVSATGIGVASAV